MTTTQRILVEVEMPHLARFGKPTLVQLTYGVTFPVRIGQLVRCPPPPRGYKWATGRVIAMGSDYAGQVRNVEHINPTTRKRLAAIEASHMNTPAIVPAISAR